jgi:hypothetical protein
VLSKLGGAAGHRAALPLSGAQHHRLFWRPARAIAADMHTLAEHILDNEAGEHPGRCCDGPGGGDRTRLMAASDAHSQKRERRQRNAASTQSREQVRQTAAARIA